MSERLKIDHCPKCGEFLHDEMGHSCPAPSEPVGTPPKCPTCGSVSHGPAEINYLMPCRDSWHDSPAPSEPEPLIGHITKGDVRKCLAEDHSECEPSADWAELERMRKALREICKNSPTDADFEIGGRYDYGEDCGNSGDVTALGAARMHYALAKIARAALLREEGSRK